MFAEAAVVCAVAVAVKFLAVALLVNVARWGVEWLLVLLPSSAVALFVVCALLVSLFLGVAL